MNHRSVIGATAATVEVDGVRLAFDADGGGPTLVCLHAVGHGASDFAGIRERFQDRFRVIALDWPGQGNSAPDRVFPSAARYAELLRGFLDAIGVDKAVLLGNSIGGADWFGRTVCRLFARFFAQGARGARWFPAAFALYYRIVLPGRAAAAQRARIV